MVRKRRFSGNVQVNDVFCFGVLDTGEDGSEGTTGSINATLHALWDSAESSSLGVYCCQWFSFPK